MQCYHLASLKALYLTTVDGKVPLMDYDRNVIDGEQWMFSRYHIFPGNYDKTISLVMNQGSFVLQKIEQIPDFKVTYLVKYVTNMYVETASIISQIIA